MKQEEVYHPSQKEGSSELDEELTEEVKILMTMIPKNLHMIGSKI